MTLLQAVEKAHRSGAKQIGDSYHRWDLEQFKEIANKFMSTCPDRKRGWKFRMEPVMPGSIGQLVRREGRTPWGGEMESAWDVY